MHFPLCHCFCHLCICPGRRKEEVKTNREPTTSVMSTATQRKKLAAEQYLAENKVHSLMEFVTSELLRFNPNDPLLFIEQRMRQLQDAPPVPEERPRIISVIGGPASGKAVQAANLAQELGAVCIAPAELLRDEVKNGTEIGKQVGEMLHANVVVPKEIVTDLIKKRIERHTAQSESSIPVVLDGFPRSIEQAMYLEAQVAEVSLALYLECSEATLRQRINERAEVNAAADDREPLVSEKIGYFQLNTIPLVEYFAGLGKLVAVNADKPIDEAMKDVLKVVH